MPATRSQIRRATPRDHDALRALEDSAFQPWRRDSARSLRRSLAQKQPSSPLVTLQQWMQELDRYRMRGRGRARPGRVVVDPASVHDAHSTLADHVAEHGLAPAEVELGAG